MSERDAIGGPGPCRAHCSGTLSPPPSPRAVGREEGAQGLGWTAGGAAPTPTRRPSRPRRCRRWRAGGRRWWRGGEVALPYRQCCGRCWWRTTPVWPVAAPRGEGCPQPGEAGQGGSGTVAFTGQLLWRASGSLRWGEHTPFPVFNSPRRYISRSNAVFMQSAPNPRVTTAQPSRRHRAGERYLVRRPATRLARREAGLVQEWVRTGAAFPPGPCWQRPHPPHSLCSPFPPSVRRPGWQGAGATASGTTPATMSAWRRGCGGPGGA